MPKVSVITPIYQTEEYLAKCFQSLTKQTLSDIELIWIDNGANEACKKLIAEHKTAAVKLIVLPENIGYTGAMNTGLDAATGDYVGFCDSDDWVDADYYEKLYAKASKEKADIVYCGYQIEYENSSKKVPLKTTSFKNCRGAIFEALPTGSVWNALFLRDFVRKVGISFGTSSKSIYRDNAFSIPACWLAQKYALEDAVFYHYRDRESSTVQGISKNKSVQAAEEIIAEIFPKLPLKNLSDTEIRLFTDFLFRTMSVAGITKFPKEAKPLCQTPYFKKVCGNYRLFSAPTFGQRIFSISYHPFKPFVKIRFLGVSIKFKLKNIRRNL